MSRRGILLALLAWTAAPRTDGWEFLQAGRPALARTAFRNQLRRTPGDVRTLTGLGLAELALGDAEGACEHLLASVEKEGADPRSRRALARAFLLRARSRIALGRGGEEETRLLVLDAENQADRAAALDPRDPESCATVAEARVLLGDVERARQAVDEAEARGLPLKRLRALRADLSYEVVRRQVEEDGGADYDAAKAELEAFVREDPGSAELWLRLGDLHRAFGRVDAALESWRRAFAIEPFDRPSLEVVLSYLKVPELREPARRVLEVAMEAALEQATGGDPRPGYALFCVGQAKLSAHELDEAVTLFKKARSVDPSLTVPCSLGLADAAFKSRRHDEAAAAWKAAFAADAGESEALLVHLGTVTSVSASLQFLADRARQKNANGEARELLAIAFELEPDSAPIANNYGFLCRETGKYDESWRAYSKLIELEPEQPRSLNDAALILSDYLKKDLALAKSLYERAIAAADALLADPGTPEATRAMAQSAKRDATDNLAKLERRGG